MISYCVCNNLQQNDFSRYFKIFVKWAGERQNKQNYLCALRRLRSSFQSDRSLLCPPEECLGLYLPTKRTSQVLIRLGGWARLLWVFAGCTCHFVVCHAPAYNWHSSVFFVICTRTWYRETRELSLISARPRAAEYTIGICKEKAKKPKVSKWLIPSGSQCKHFFHHQCRKPFILKSRRSLAVLRPDQLILLFQNSHGLTGILHSIVSGFSGLVIC